MNKNSGRKRPPFSEEWKRNMSLGQKRRKPHSEETKRKISVSHIGNTWGFKKGHKPSEKNIKINSERMKDNKIGKKFESGEKHWNWKGGTSRKFRYRFKRDTWDSVKKSILQRDNLTCQLCGNKEKRLDVHHIIPYRVSLDNSPKNLITLCINCHIKEEHKYYGKRRFSNENV